MGSISCQNQLILDAWRRYLAAKGRFSCPGPLRGCTATKYCHNLPLRNALRLDLTQEGTFGCTRFFVAVLASPRKGHITALTPPRRGRTATLAPPATALAPSHREHANTAVKDEPQRWSCTKLPRRQESQSSHTKDESKKRGNICPLCMI